MFLRARLVDPERLNKKVECGNSIINDFNFSITNSNFPLVYSL